MQKEDQSFDKILHLKISYEKACNEVDIAISELFVSLNNSKDLCIVYQNNGVLNHPEYLNNEKIDHALSKIEYSYEIMLRSIALRRNIIEEILTLRRALPDHDFPENIIF